MIELRPLEDLGVTHSKGLSGRHHFSFAAYQRANRIDWGALRALNFYRLEAGAVRQPAFHAGFEILTLVMSGTLRRIGSFEPRQTLRAGGLELVSTGSGTNLGVATMGLEPAEYIEIWVRSNTSVRRARRQSLAACPVGIEHLVAPDALTRSAGLSWHADASVLRVRPTAGQALDLRVTEERYLYLAVLEGEIAGGGLEAVAGDALAMAGTAEIQLRAERASDLLIIETGVLS